MSICLVVRKVAIGLDSSSLQTNGRKVLITVWLGCYYLCLFCYWVNLPNRTEFRVRINRISPLPSISTSKNRLLTDLDFRRYLLLIYDIVEEVHAIWKVTVQ